MSRKSKDTDSNTPSHQVVDFGKAREQKLEEKRRNTERLFFTQLLGIYGVTDQEKMLPIDLVDMSMEGIAFKVTEQAALPKEMKSFVVRLYFSQESYLPVNVTVQNTRPYIEEGIRYIRYGTLVDPTHSAYEAYMNFVRFLKSYSTHAHRDMGDVTLFYV